MSWKNDCWSSQKKHCNDDWWKSEEKCHRDDDWSFKRNKCRCKCFFICCHCKRKNW